MILLGMHNVLLCYVQKGCTPVILAAIGGNKDVVMILIQRGANLELFNEVSIQCDYYYIVS